MMHYNLSNSQAVALRVREAQIMIALPIQLTDGPIDDPIEYAKQRLPKDADHIRDAELVELAVCRGTGEENGLTGRIGGIRDDEWIERKGFHWLVNAVVVTLCAVETPQTISDKVQWPLSVVQESQVKA